MPASWAFFIDWANSKWALENADKDQINVDRIFRALGDPTRRALVEKLSKGPVPASILAKTLEITLSAVIQHLQVLEESGLIHTQKLGRVRSCQIEPKGLSLAEQWLSDRRSLWTKRYDRLEKLLAAPDDI